MRAVDKRIGKDVITIDTISDFGNRVLSAAGKSANIEFIRIPVISSIVNAEELAADFTGTDEEKEAKLITIINYIDENNLSAATAEAAGIPVIAYDRLIMNSDAVSYYATFDNWDVGVKQGTYIAEALDLANAGDKTYNIEFITGDPGDNNINFFFGGAMEVLQPYLDAGTLVCPSGQVEKMDVATPGWASDAAQARFENILATYYSDGTQLHAVMANNDSTALGVANALASSYTGEYPVLTGQDCDIASVKNMLAGTQSMSVFKDTRTLAAKVVEMVDAIMKGAEPPINDTETYDNGTGVIPSFLCEPVSATVDDIQTLLIDSGYYTEADLAN